MIRKKSIAKPLTELTIATAFWGFGFVGSIWALQYLGTPAIIFYRFLLAVSAGSFILFFLKPKKKDLFHEFKISFFAGALLSLTLILQTWGLQYTTATKSAFITTTYVVIVPILSHFFLNKRLQALHWVWVFLAIMGTLLIVDMKIDKLTLGDGFTVANAFTAALHILYVDKIAQKSKHHFAFNVFQSLWSGIFALLLVGLNTRWDIRPLDTKAWIGLISLGLGSSLLGFFLQVRAQKEIKPALASLLFLMESPMSFLFAFLLLGETLSRTQLSGAILILVACISATIFRDSKILRFKQGA